MNRLRSVFSRDSCQKYYNLTRVLGKGTFASVKLAVRKSDGTHWAVKIIDKASLSHEDENALRTEVEILQSMDHPNIVKLDEVFDCHSNFYMVMELCTGGELFDRILMKDHYTENEARVCIKEVVNAILYCHQQGIVHRDLKPENLLYSEPDEGKGVLKLADFGLAKLLSSDAMLTTACGTPGYVAPEILEGKPYGKEVDMWSIGVIAYILLCGFPPFYDENNHMMYDAIKAGRYDYPSPFWDDVDPEAKDMVDCLLVLDAEKRFTAEQLLEHPWMTQRPSETGGRRLDHFKQSLRAYNARRKFKASIMTVQMMNMLGKNVAELDQPLQKGNVPVEGTPGGGKLLVRSGGSQGASNEESSTSEAPAHSEEPTPTTTDSEPALVRTNQEPEPPAGGENDGASAADDSKAAEPEVPHG